MQQVLWETYRRIRPQIEARLAEFRAVGQKGSDPDLFAELAYCLLTPQARGRYALETVEYLRATGLLWHGTVEEIVPHLRRVRFRRKAEYLVRAREFFRAPDGTLRVREKLAPWLRDPPAARRWLVQHLLGMGYKEASHFLRNIGYGEDLAILDRHILRRLVDHGVIQALPRTLTPRRYEALEQEMRAFARRVGIPLAHLDLLFWYLGTGEVLK